MILSSSPRRNSRKYWLVAVLSAAIIGVIASVMIWWKGHQEPAPPILLSAAEETHIAIEEWITEHGMKVYLVTADTLPILDLRLIFDAGSARDGDRSGLAELTSRVWLHGTTDFDAEQIADRIDGVGAHLNTSVSRDMTMMALRTLTEKELFETAFTTLLSVISTPVFPRDAIERERQRLLSSLEEQLQLPNVIASNAFYSALYGDHPYAQPVMGLPQTVSRISENDIIDFANRYFNKQNAVLAMVGNISLEEAKILANRIEQALPDGAPASALPSPEPLKAKEMINIPFNSTQTHVLYGNISIDRLSPDYYSLYVGNLILGGSGLVSMLFEEVREKRGLAYNSSSQLLPMKQMGPFVMGAQTRNESTEEVIVVLEQTIKDFITNGPTPEQVRTAQSNITGNFALHLDSNAAVVDQLSAMAFYDLPNDYLASFQAHILSVTPEQVKEAMQKHIDLNNTVLVTVGYVP